MTAPPVIRIHEADVKRQPVSARHIMIGLQCGGSDGYSGISANPALGAAVDRLVRHDGTAILSETPEIYGGEHLLTGRAVSKDVADKPMQRIRWWERYCERNHGSMDNNPSAGNKAGGLRAGSGLHGHARLRPGVGQRPGGRRREPDTALWEKQQDDIQRVLATASGERTKSEVHGYRQNEFVPWVLGATM